MISKQKEPPPDKKAKIEEREFKDHTLDKITKRKMLKRVWWLLYVNYGMVFLIVLLEGITVLDFELDPLVLVSLIGGVMGSSAIHVIKRSVDFAYTN